jgi:hypothetical protein
MSKKILKTIAILASIAGIVGCCIALIGLIPAFGQWLYPREIARTNISPSTTNTPAIITNNPTEGSNPVIVSPTDPPTETIVPEIQPTGSVFFDDFENTLSPQWKVIYGQLDMFDGKLTVVDPSRTPNAYHYIILDNLYWKDLTIEIELAPFDGAFYGGEADSIGAIVLHQNNDAPSVGLRFYTASDGLQFGTLSTEGEWLLPTSLVDGFANDFTLHDRVHTIKVVAKGLSYTAYIDNRKITSTSIPGNEIRVVGLWFKTSTVDKPDFFAPRIESVKITAN